MADDDTMRKWPIGTVVVPNKLHRRQFRQSIVTRGTVVGYAKWPNGVRVKWEETKRPDELHSGFLSADP